VSAPLSLLDSHDSTLARVPRRVYIAAMSTTAPTTVFCSRLKQELPAITSRMTFTGAFADKVRAHVSQQAWTEWLAMQIKVINEYRLHLGEPSHRQFLEDSAAKFFCLDGSDGTLGAGPEGGLSGL
jgi:Fe-S cluster biosynthesis and repair protein YggX